MGPADENPMTETFDERPAALDVGRHAGNDDEELAYLGGIRISQHRRARMRRFPELAVFGVILRKNLPYARRRFANATSAAATIAAISASQRQFRQ